MDKRFTKIIAYVVTLVWATSFIADIISPRYDPPASVGGVMMIVVGAVFAGNVFTRAAEPDEEKKRETKD